MQQIITTYLCILIQLQVQGDPDGCAGFYVVIVAMPLDFGKYQGAFQITKKRTFDNFEEYLKIWGIKKYGLNFLISQKAKSQ